MEIFVLVCYNCKGDCYILENKKEGIFTEMDKQTFLSKYDLVESDLIEADITWEELVLIEEEYKGHENKLREIGKNFIDEYLYDIECGRASEGL